MPKQQADQVTKIRGFKVEIKGLSQPTGDPDSAWESMTGGAVCFEVADATTPGHKYIDEVTLRGPLTAGRKAMVEWINATAQGADWKRNVTVTEILKNGTDGKSYTYHDCLPIRYESPPISAEGSGKLIESLTFKPIRLDLT